MSGPTVDGRALGERLRRALGAVPDAACGDAAGDDGPVERVEDALDALETLLDLGWADPARVEDLLTAEQAGGTRGVRSLAEDLAVARLRARTAGQDGREAVARARAAVARSHRLAAEAARRRAATGRPGPDDADDADRVAALERQVEQLRTALSSRPRIEHAVGVVMATVGCDAERAWDLLSRLSQHTNVKVRVAADALTGAVAAGGGVPPEVTAALRVLAAGGRLGAGRGAR
ncbi:ANTAR domain-containing protein [Kineococcus sp. SYSU DK002]|uniref:ANTAR domain-containing protein n=1 Tax=Kineococcus sp. SYSU DK002 TaxID=3383123 RepID=UPI003D7EB053